MIWSIQYAKVVIIHASVVLGAIKPIVSVVKQIEPSNWQIQVVHAKMVFTNFLKFVIHVIPLARHAWVFPQIVHHVIQP
jgi:hypothetical protein